MRLAIGFLIGFLTGFLTVATIFVHLHRAPQMPNDDENGKPR